MHPRSPVSAKTVPFPSSFSESSLGIVLSLSTLSLKPFSLSSINLSVKNFESKYVLYAEIEEEKQIQNVRENEETEVLY